MPTVSLPDNPFTPTFGEAPAHMAGRDLILSELRRAYGSVKRHPALATAIAGARGSGKTALLAAAADIAEQLGWVAVRTVATPGMLDDILITARRQAAHLVPSSGAKVSGVEIAQVIGVTSDRQDAPTNWRNEMTVLLEQLSETNTGLLVSVDELQPTLDEVVHLAAVYQLFVTEGRKVALLMAGLPNNVLALEKDKTVSFMRRANRHVLGRIADHDVRDAMRRTVEDSGRRIDDDALDIAVEASGGFPFLMQLVGFKIWDRHPDRPTIGKQDAAEGAELARLEMKEHIVKVSYDALSPMDKRFLDAMVAEGGAATVSSIAKRMGKSVSYATQYKNRLVGQGIVEQDGSGMLSFQMPMMLEYVQELR